jgi:hypothetical protein
VYAIALSFLCRFAALTGGKTLKNKHLLFLSRDALTTGIDFRKLWANRKYFLELKTLGSHISGEESAIR